MMNFFKYIALVAVIFMCSCTKVDDMLGLDFIPNDEQMMLNTTTLRGMNTYSDTLVILPSTRLGVALFGAETSTFWGQTLAQSIVQFAPSYFPKKDFYGEHKPTLDSVWLYLSVGAVSGDTLASTKPKFSIYKMTEKLSLDSTYKTNYNPTGQYAEKLFDITLESSSKNIHKFKISDTWTSEGQEYFKSLVDADKKLYDTDTAFLNKFRGWFIATDESKAIYTVALEKSYMTLHTHNYKSAEDVSEINIKDTIAVSYSFADDPNYYYPTSVNMIQHDYTSTDILATIDSTSNFPVVYYQSMAGVTPKIKFKDEFLASIEALKVQDGITFKNIVINKAELVIQTKKSAESPLLTYLNAAPSRLGSYINYAKYAPIADYYYTYENSGYTIPYGGYFNRSKELYSMDISVFVQRMIRDKSAPRAFTLGATPDVGSIYGAKHVVLYGNDSSDTSADTKSIKVKLTYTLIRD